MEDLEVNALKNSGISIPFYFKYVDRYGCTI